jgi:hypothetical protein
MTPKRRLEYLQKSKMTPTATQDITALVIDSDAATIRQARELVQQAAREVGHRRANRKLCMRGVLRAAEAKAQRCRNYLDTGPAQN